MGDQLSSPFDLLSQLIAIACEHLKMKTVVYWGWWWAWGRGAVDKRDGTETQRSAVLKGALTSVDMESAKLMTKLECDMGWAV